MDTEQDGTWLSYLELGKLRGISKESSLKLALRRKRRKQADNEGTIRVFVPPRWIGRQDIGVDKRTDRKLGTVNISADTERMISSLGDALTTLREQLAAGHAANLRMVDEIAGLRIQVSAAVAERDTARQEREDSRVIAARAEGEVEALRDALADARRPLWRRLVGIS